MNYMKNTNKVTNCQVIDLPLSFLLSKKSADGDNLTYSESIFWYIRCRMPLIFFSVMTGTLSCPFHLLKEFSRRAAALFDEPLCRKRWASFSIFSTLYLRRFWMVLQWYYKATANSDWLLSFLVIALDKCFRSVKRFSFLRREHTGNKTFYFH